MIKIQVQLIDNKTKDILDWDSLYVDFVNKTIFYKNEVIDLKNFKKRFSL